MSCRSWTENGYGIDLENLPHISKKKDKLKSFVIKHRRDILEDFSLTSNSTAEEFYDELENYESGSGYESSWAIVAETMSNETNIPFEYFYSEYGEVIMYLPSYPWSILSDKEKNLTKTEINNIFKNYLEELGYKNVSVDYRSIEFFG